MFNLTPISNYLLPVPTSFAIPVATGPNEGAVVLAEESFTTCDLVLANLPPKTGTVLRNQVCYPKARLRLPSDSMFISNKTKMLSLSPSKYPIFFIR